MCFIYKIINSVSWSKGMHLKGYSHFASCVIIMLKTNSSLVNAFLFDELDIFILEWIEKQIRFESNE